MLSTVLAWQEGIRENALVPTYHCMHTPGGPLKYSLEGHQFAIFAMKLTSDNRYIISCSNKFITFDVVTSDLARQVYPKVEGLMIGLELSPDNKERTDLCCKPISRLAVMFWCPGCVR